MNTKYHKLPLDNGDIQIGRCQFRHEVPTGPGWVEHEGATYRVVTTVRAMVDGEPTVNPSLVADMVVNSLHLGSLTEAEVIKSGGWW